MIELWVVASLILVAGMIDDLRSRKVHNVVVVVGLLIAVSSSLFFRGFEGSLAGIFALILALLVTIPLFATGVLGGGDVKLFAAFAMAVEPNSMFWTLLYSFIWGALFGVTRAALQKQLPALVRNTHKLSRGARIVPQELQKVPYTFALLLGWFTQLTWLHLGGGL